MKRRKFDMGGGMYALLRFDSGGGCFAQIWVPGDWDEVCIFESDLYPSDLSTVVPLLDLAAQLRAAADDLDEAASRLDAEEGGE
jgi:hypothetical protein